MHVGRYDPDAVNAINGTIITYGQVRHCWLNIYPKHTLLYVLHGTDISMSPFLSILIICGIDDRLELGRLIAWRKVLTYDITSSLDMEPRYEIKFTRTNDVYIFLAGS